MENKNKCPIPNTHKKLKTTYQIWERCIESYHKPEDFLINLNSLVQEMRNITFRLQKEKSGIKNFNEWYETKREEMKRNKKLHWIIDTRNKIVKESDLNAESFAKVILSNWNKYPLFELRIDATTSNRLIAEYTTNILKLKNIKIQDIGFIVVERRWSVQEFKNENIIEILLENIKSMSELISEAHDINGCCISLCKEDFYLNKKMFTKSIIALEEIKESNIDPENFKTIVTKEIEVDKKYEKKAERRYNVGIKREMSQQENIVAEDMISIMSSARAILKKDKHHVPMAILDGGKIISGLFSNQNEKYLWFEKVAKEIKLTDSKKCILIGEIWLTDVEKIKKNKKEALQVIKITSEGDLECYIIPFRKTVFNKIKFKKAERIDRSAILNLLNPIFKAWNISFNQSKS